VFSVCFVHVLLLLCISELIWLVECYSAVTVSITWAIQLIGGLLKPVHWTVNSDSWAFDGTDTVRTVYRM